MIIQQKNGNLQNINLLNRKPEWLELEWFEANKRILRKKTIAGTEIVFRSLDKDPEFADGDILYADDETVVAVKIQACEAVVLKPATMFEMAAACYEIGNKHAPLFYEEDELLMPFEFPLFRSLQTLGFDVKQEQRKLLKRLKTTVDTEILFNSNTIVTKISKQPASEQ
jgi:urease accessory protein